MTGGIRLRLSPLAKQAAVSLSLLSGLISFWISAQPPHRTGRGSFSSSEAPSGRTWPPAPTHVRREAWPSQKLLQASSTNHSTIAGKLSRIAQRTRRILILATFETR